MPTEPAATAQYLTFVVAGGTYGIPVRAVNEILQYEEVTAVPGTPAAVRGIVNVRGGAVPVVDLARRLGVGTTTPTGRTCIVVVDAPGVAGGIGLLADEVTEVADVAAADVEPPPALGNGERAPYLTGVARSGRRFALLLDLPMVLSTLDAADPAREQPAPAACA